MTREYLRDYNTNEILGIIETDSDGDQTGRIYPSYKIVGYYRSKENITTDYIRRVLSKGNTLSSLVMNEALKTKKR